MFYYKVTKDLPENGPITKQELRHLAKTGMLSPDSYIRKADSKSWVNLTRVKNLYGSPGEPESSTESAKAKAPVPQHKSHSPVDRTADAANSTSPMASPRRWKAAAALLVSLSLLLSLGIVIVLVRNSSSGSETTEPSKQPAPAEMEVAEHDDSATDSTAAQPSEEPPSISEMLETCEQAVVGIESNFGEFGGATGSGFLVEDGSLVVTNYHVIEGAVSATVTLSNGERLDVVGIRAYEPETDLAILKIWRMNSDETARVSTLQLAVDVPKKGEAVFAIGSPLELRGTITRGIVSAIRRGSDVDSSLSPSSLWIQTDTSISHGNSGGPLIDESGKVVGVSTLGRVGGNNLNFASSALSVRALIASTLEDKVFAFDNLPPPSPDSFVGRQVAARQELTRLQNEAENAAIAEI